ncbi:hypothetical protein SDC9_105826 [bioreactor metagenome]|uniref:NADPH-dependent FMN reductase-like domain-containing protein n=1 Tax=bioreactor metagenome TaxID=1076179 RepID=A0A645B0Q1_9ZZZZ|nr:NAD(P)H-dependent oxidoreductase [Oscillospiraceae bacterium]
MKIVLIHGQNHKGSTYHIGSMLAEKIGGKNEICEYFLPRDLNHFCIGCYSCIMDDTKCPYYTEKRVIMDSVEAADLLIFTTPNYCMMPSAQMKAFIDLTFNYWMSHKPRGCMFTKKAAVISTAAGAGAGKAAGGIAKTLFFWGVPYIKSYGIAVQAKCWDDVKPEKKNRIEHAMTKLAKKLSNGKPPRIGIKTRFIFNKMAGMQKAGWGSSTEKKYWEDNGWLGKARPWK